MNKQETKIFNLLKTLALSGDFVSNASLAAAVVYGNEIVGFGQNSYKSHPFQQKFSKNKESIYLHAETCAIKNALKRVSLVELSKSKLYILRVKRDGSTGLAKPCEGCQRCINTFGIKKIKYTIEGDKFND